MDVEIAITIETSAKDNSGLKWSIPTKKLCDEVNRDTEVSGNYQAPWKPDDAIMSSR